MKKSKKAPKLDFKQGSTAPVMPGMEPTKQPEKYQVREWLNTVADAHEIQNDPEKMKHVHKLVGRHKKAITSLKDLKDAYNDKFGPDAKDHDESSD